MKELMRSEDILKTEYSEPFDIMRKNSMVVGFYEYGPIKINYDNGLIKAIPSCEECIELYKQTGNKKYLVDMANFAMIEFKHPSHPKSNCNREDSPKSATVKKSSYRDLEG